MQGFTFEVVASLDPVGAGGGGWGAWPEPFPGVSLDSTFPGIVCITQLAGEGGQGLRVGMWKRQLGMENSGHCNRNLERMGLQLPWKDDLVEPKPRCA